MMFDYQAGEKFKLTLIMVGFAGVMAGMLFTMLLMPPAAEPPKRSHAHIKWATNPDVTGQGSVRGRRAADRLNAQSPQDGAQQSTASADQGRNPAAPSNPSNPANPANPGQPPAPAAPPVTMANPQEAVELVRTWLVYTWDFNAGSAPRSQEQAIMYMTPECATAYRQNVWTADMAKQVQDAGLQSQFEASKLEAGQPQTDGSVVIFVEGKQTLSVPGKGTQEKPIAYQYLVKLTADGYRIAGISEGGSQS